MALSETQIKVPLVGRDDRTFARGASWLRYVQWRHAVAAVCAWLFLVQPGTSAKAQSTSQQIYLQCLTNFEAYAQNIWHPSGTIPDSGYWGDGGSTGNGGIRGNSGIALAYAVLCVALPNDPKFTSRLAYVRQALNYDYNTHVTGSYNTTDGHP